jgi:hypothetical protein
MKPKILIEFHGIENYEDVVAHKIRPGFTQLLREHRDFFPVGIDVDVEFFLNPVERITISGTRSPRQFLRLVCRAFNGHRLIVEMLESLNLEVQVLHLDT